MPVIKEIFAYCAYDEPGDEGIIGWQTPDKVWIPLVGADIKRMESLRPIAVRIGKSTGKIVNLKRFKLVNMIQVTKRKNYGKER